MKQLAFCFLLILLFAAHGLAQARTSKVPSGLVNQLIRDNSSVSECIRKYRGGKSELLTYLTLRTVDLNKDGQVEYIVQGDDNVEECLRGNRVSSVWLYRKTKNGFELMLSGGNDFTPLKTYTNGYRDLKEPIGGGAFELYTTIYKFDGNSYQRSQCLEYQAVEGRNGKFSWKLVKRGRCSD